jgi:hypothetical protein
VIGRQRQQARPEAGPTGIGPEYDRYLPVMRHDSAEAG